MVAPGQAQIFCAFAKPNSVPTALRATTDALSRDKSRPAGVLLRISSVRQAPLSGDAASLRRTALAKGTADLTRTLDQFYTLVDCRPFGYAIKKH